MTDRSVIGYAQPIVTRPGPHWCLPVTTGRIAPLCGSASHPYIIERVFAICKTCAPVRMMAESMSRNPGIIGRMMPELANKQLPARIAISGRGLQLREWADTDLQVMVGLFDEQQIARWTPLVSPFDLAAAEAYLAKARRAREAGAGIQLAITTDGQQALGEVLLYRAGKHRADGEIAYAIGAKYRRQRLAVRAVQLMTAYAYDQLGMGRAILRIAADNEGSIGVAVAAGFQLADEPPVFRERKGRKVSLLTWACHAQL